MAFFRNEPIDEVARQSNICAEGLVNNVLLAKSGITKARERLGDQPLAWLFQQSAAHCEQSAILLIAGMIRKCLLWMARSYEHKTTNHCALEFGFRDIKSTFQYSAMTLPSKKVALVFQ